MQQIVLFIEPNDDSWCISSKIAHLFMNRFAVDEDAGFEILKVLELGKSSWKMTYTKHPEHTKFQNEGQQKGMNLIDHVKN